MTGFGVIGAGTWGLLHARVYAATPGTFLAAAWLKRLAIVGSGRCKEKRRMSRREVWYHFVVPSERPTVRVKGRTLSSYTIQHPLSRPEPRTLGI